MYPALPLNRTNDFFRNENYSQTNLLSTNQRLEQKLERPFRKRPTNTYAARYLNQDQYIPEPVNINPKPSDGLRDRIQRERRAHTMAPLTRITGPSSTPQAKLFASTYAPTVAQPPQPKHVMTNDDTPVIIKVRYDPRTGIRPSEEFVRAALDQQIRNHQSKKQPIIMNYFGKNFSTEIPKTISQPRVAPRAANPFSHPPHPFVRHKSHEQKTVPKPMINRSQIHPLKTSQLSNQSHRTESHLFKSLDCGIATEKMSTTVNNQQSLANISNAGSVSDDVFRPPPIKDIPELSRENLLSMLNQIPDLQGRQFKIEYAISNAPESYPIPVEHLTDHNNSFPEAVYTDTLPTNVIQHVKNSNNPAITAALEATIQQEHNVPARSTVNIQSNYPAQSSAQVQESRPASSTDSDSDSSSSSSESIDNDDTEISSSESEESEEIISTGLPSNLPFVSSISSSQYQYR